jgi:hypothetical protein
MGEIPMTFDPTKPVQTRGGSKARIICTDRKYPGGGAPFTIVAVVQESDYEAVHLFTVGGKIMECGYNDGDLVNIPQRIQREVWVNVYQLGFSSSHNRKEDADSYCKTLHDALSPRLACVKLTIDCLEGEGL